MRATHRLLILLFLATAVFSANNAKDTAQDDLAYINSLLSAAQGGSNSPESPELISLELEKKLGNPKNTVSIDQIMSQSQHAAQSSNKKSTNRSTIDQMLARARGEETPKKKPVSRIDQLLAQAHGKKQSNISQDDLSLLNILTEVQAKQGSPIDRARTDETSEKEKEKEPEYTVPEEKKERYRKLQHYLGLPGPRPVKTALISGLKQTLPIILTAGVSATLANKRNSITLPNTRPLARHCSNIFCQKQAKSILDEDPDDVPVSSCERCNTPYHRSCFNQYQSECRTLITPIDIYANGVMEACGRKNCSLHGDNKCTICSNEQRTYRMRRKGEAPEVTIDRLDTTQLCPICQCEFNIDKKEYAENGYKDELYRPIDGDTNSREISWRHKRCIADDEMHNYESVENAIKNQETGELEYRTQIIEDPKTNQLLLKNNEPEYKHHAKSGIYRAVAFGSVAYGIYYIGRMLYTTEQKKNKLESFVSTWPILREQLPEELYPVFDPLYQQYHKNGKLLISRSNVSTLFHALNMLTIGMLAPKQLLTKQKQRLHGLEIVLAGLTGIPLTIGLLGILKTCYEALLYNKRNSWYGLDYLGKLLGSKKRSGEVGTTVFALMIPIALYLIERYNQNDLALKKFVKEWEKNKPYTDPVFHEMFSSAFTFYKQKTGRVFLSSDITDTVGQLARVNTGVQIARALRASNNQ